MWFKNIPSQTGMCLESMSSTDKTCNHGHPDQRSIFGWPATPSPKRNPIASSFSTLSTPVKCSPFLMYVRWRALSLRLPISKFSPRCEPNSHFFFFLRFLQLPRRRQCLISLTFFNGCHRSASTWHLNTAGAKLADLSGGGLKHPGLSFAPRV